MARRKSTKKEVITPTSLTAISREPSQAVTGVVVYTVFTRSTVLTRVIDTFIDVFKKKEYVDLIKSKSEALY